LREVLLPPIKAPALTVLTAEPGLSLAAKGLAAFLLSAPARPIPGADLPRAPRDGMPFIDAAIRELVDVGMVERVPTRRRDGMVEHGGIVLRQP
jgi:hypothetical protein